MYACTLYFQKLESLAYIFVADSTGLSSVTFLQWAPKDACFLNGVRFGRSRSSKFDDFGTNRKRIYDFLLVVHCDYLALFLRHTTTYWLKIAYFS